MALMFLSSTKIVRIIRVNSIFVFHFLQYLCLCPLKKAPFHFNLTQPSPASVKVRFNIDKIPKSELSMKINNLGCPNTYLDFLLLCFKPVQMKRKISHFANIRAFKKSAVCVSDVCGVENLCLRFFL